MRKEEIIITSSMETLHVHLGNFLRYLINLNTFLRSGALERKKRQGLYKHRNFWCKDGSQIGRETASCIKRGINCKAVVIEQWNADKLLCLKNCLPFVHMCVYFHWKAFFSLLELGFGNCSSTMSWFFSDLSVYLLEQGITRQLSSLSI